jgi:phosphatidylethanolamine-binding protein (PEBP) family uncharacterized protein
MRHPAHPPIPPGRLGSGPASPTANPEHHYVALLAALDAYAHQLAARIDAGQPTDWTHGVELNAAAAS